MRRCFFISLLSMMCVMCSSGSEWQSVIDNAHNNPSTPADPSDNEEPETPADEPQQEPSGEAVVTFGVFTDSHYSATKANKTDRFYSASKQKIQDAVDTFNAEKVDMVFSLGDLVDNEYEDYQDVGQYLAQLSMPMYKVLGNHDFITPFSSQQQTEALKVLGISNRYFSIIKGDFRLIFLDTSDVAKYSNEEGTEAYRKAENMLAILKDDLEPNAKQYNGAIGKQQQDWLDAELRAALNESQKVICFAHIPLYIDGAKQYTLWNREDIKDMLAPYKCVKAFVAGHHHAGGYADDGGFHHITLKGMVMGEDTSYSVIRLYDDRMVIDGYGRENDCEYKFR